MTSEAPIAFRYEVLRKAVHITTAIVASAAALYWYANPYIPAFFLVLALLTCTIDVLRLRHSGVGEWFDRKLGSLIREKERGRLTGATTMWIGFAVAILSLPMYYAAAGMLFVGFGDGVAAIVGRLFGRHRFPNGKSLEGSIACFGAALFGAAVVPVPYAGLVAGALTVTVLELLPLPFDDNVLLPAAGGAVALIVASIL